MIPKQELIRKHKEQGVPLPTIEKDYILGLIFLAFIGTPLSKTIGFLKVEPA